MFRVLAIFLIVFAAQRLAYPLEVVEAERDGQRLSLTGELLVEAEDGGILLRSRDLTLWTLQPDELISRHATDSPFTPLDRIGLREQLSEALPRGFEFYDTPHFLIGFNTTTSYARWCGTLYERLYRSFENYWKRRDMELTDPPAPLVALVFRDKPSYQAYAAAELGEHTAIVGYYSLRTNRIATFDLTGVDNARPLGDRPGNTALVNAILSQPNATSTVATVIHEATHQLAYNRGLQVRYADNPLWLSEGLAMFFETPDIRNPKGWKRIGTINDNRLVQFKQYLGSRREDSLRTLIEDDARMREMATAMEAYAESWALCYFLIRKHPKEFDNYLRELSGMVPLLYDTPEDRLQTFRQFFGKDLKRLDDEFIRYMSRQR